MANFTVKWSTTETTARMSAKFSGGDPNFGGERYVAVSVNDVVGMVTDDSGGADSAFSYRISGLEPDTEYEYVVELGYQAGSEIVWLDSLTRKGTFITKVKIPTVEPWSWLKSNGSATAAQTQNAYHAVNSQGPTTDFSYKVWNDLVDKTNETAQAAGRSWDGFYLSLSETKMAKDSKVMTADRFNSLCYNINFGYNTGLPVVSKGDTIKGEYFVTLANALNHWIDKL